MQTKIKQFVKNNHTFIKFLFVGGLNTLFGYGVYALFLKLGFYYTSAVFWATVLSILFNFKTTGYLVFKNKNNRLIFNFLGVYLIVYLVNIFCLKLFDLFSFNLYFAGFILLLPMALLSFFLLRTFVFKNLAHD